MASFLAVWLTAGVASANSAPLPVSFAESGRQLPQAEIRVGIATELGRETLTESGVAGAEATAEKEDGGGGGLSEQDPRERVVVAVDELGQLWVRYWGPRGLVDRHLAMPEHAEQVPLVVSLAVGNLVRQEAFELLRDLERRRAEQAKANASEPVVAPKPAAVRPQPALPKRPRVARACAPKRQNSWGHYLIGDLGYVPSMDRVCAPSSDIPCYDRNDEPAVYDVEGAGVAGGIQAAHARYVMSYARALSPDLWASVRVGFAFSGGKAKTRAAEHGASSPKFMPWLLELRLQHYFRGAWNGALRPYVHVATGIAEVSAELKLAGPAAFGGNASPSVPEGTVTAVHAMGLAFAGAGLGASLALFDGLRLETELSAFLAFPSSGWGLRPGVGLGYDF